MKLGAAWHDVPSHRFYAPAGAAPVEVNSRGESFIAPSSKLNPGFLACGHRLQLRLLSTLILTPHMKHFAGIVRRMGFISLLVLTTAGNLLAQSSSGAIEGRVFTSATSQSIQGAIVRVLGADFRADTARDGTFTVRNVPPGTYELEASYFGLTPVRASVTVVSGETAVVAIDLSGSAVVKLAAMTVEAEVLGQARATNQQRVAEAMVNISSEELFGEMTDNNIAEALQRVPGVSANSDGGTEIPRYVNIRGFDGSLNSVQLNGSRLPTSGTGQGTVYGETARAFALDDLPANAITNIEIVKAPTPDMDGDTVGGIVNLITKSALDRGGRVIDFSAGVDYIALRETFVPNFTFGFSDVLMQGKLGVRLDLSYFKGDEGFDNIDYDSLPLVPQLAFNQYLNLPRSGFPVLAHEDTEYNTYLIERDRYGFSASIDYKLSDRSTLYFRPMYTWEKRSEDDRRYHKIMDNQHGRTASAPPAGAAVGTVYTGALGQAIVTEPGRGAYRTLESISFEAGRTTLLPNGNGRGQAGYRQTLNERDIEFYSFDFGGRHELGWGDLEWNLFQSESSKEEDSRSVRFDRNGFRWAYDRPDVFRPDYRVVNGLNPLAVPVRGAVDYFVNPSSSNVTQFDRSTKETVTQVKVDLTMPFLTGTGINGAFKTGAKIRFMERSSDRDQFYWSLTSFGTYDVASYLKESDYTVSGFDMPYYPDAGRIIGEAQSGNAAYRPDTSNARRVNSVNNDYEASEDSLEAYAMGTFNVGPKLRLIAGLRAEHTTFEATTPLYDPLNVPLARRAPSTVSNENDYTVVLPGFHVRYEARNNIVARAAYTHTYGRPAFRESIAVTNFDDVNNTISTGNPELEPYHSQNFDFSVEFFGRKATYLQIALFHKKVENFVLELGRTIDGSEGYRGLPLVPGETYTLSTFSNQHDATNRGIEIAGRYRFVDLPSPFDGLYLDGSVTYTDSDGKYSDRPGEDLPSYGASEWLYFAALGFQKDRFAVQLSYRYRSDYLEGLESVDQQNRELGFPPDAADDWWGPEKYWNLESSYRVTRNFKVYCNVSNLSEYTNSSYQSPPENRYPEDSYWGKMRISFGVKGQF
jgi:TonB-dependent receptor